MLKRAAAFVTTALVVSTLFAGCGGSASSPAATPSPTQPASQPSASDTASQSPADNVSGNIQLFTYRDDLLNTWYQQALADFKTKYPNVTVTTATSKNFEPDLKVKMSANDMPDIFTLNSVNFSDAQRSQYMLPLDDVFPDLVSQWQGNDVNVNASDKKTYGLTFGLNGVALAYNKKIFSDLGLTPPKTLNDLITDGKKIKATGKIGFVGCFKQSWNLTQYWNAAQAQMNNEASTYANWLNTDTPFTPDSEIGKMMNVLSQLCAAGIMEDDPVSYDWEPYLKDFGSGQAGMAFTWTNTPVQYAGRGDGSTTVDDFGMVPFPYDNSGSPAVYESADWSMAISKDSKNLPAAEAFFKWHMDGQYADYAKNNAEISARKGTATDIGYLNELAASSANVHYGVKYPDDFKTFIDKIQMTFYDQFADVAAGTSPADELNKMNTMWKQGRAQ